MTTTIALPLLDRVRVASPCAVRWDDMTRVGDGERVRHCGQCRLNVHNLSGMTRAEAESLITSRLPGQRLCGRFYQRPDGTMLTRDCPVGLRAVRARIARFIVRLAAAASFLIAGISIARPRDGAGNRGGLAGVRPFSTLTEWARGLPTPPGQLMLIQGDICIPSPNAATGASAPGGGL